MTKFINDAITQDLSHVKGKMREELVAMDKRQSQIKQGQLVKISSSFYCYKILATQTTIFYGVLMISYFVITEFSTIGEIPIKEDPTVSARAKYWSPNHLHCSNCSLSSFDHSVLCIQIC